MPIGNEPLPPYDPILFCQQCHALYDRLEQRRQEIMQDPNFNEGNDKLLKELERTVTRIAIIRECFEQFCPS